MLNLCAFWGIISLTSPLTYFFAVNVDFRIYPTADPDVYTQFNYDTVKDLTFDINKKYVILTHGWITGFHADWYNQTIRAFANRPDTVVLTAGYEDAMSCYLYVGAVINIRVVGQKVGDMIYELTKKGISVDQIEIVGHSLGAHIAAKAGATVKDYTGKLVRRIFGLDPAGILVPDWPLNKNERLDTSDALKVIVIHTSKIGMEQPLGHVDFYPNGGKEQKECDSLYISEHMVATYYFFCSVCGQCTNWGYRCDNYDRFKANQCFEYDQQLMGYDVSDTALGNYYLNVTTCV